MTKTPCQLKIEIPFNGIMSVLKMQKVVAKKFQKNPYYTGMLLPNTIPYLGPYGIACLRTRGITTGNHLLMVYIGIGRDPFVFSQWLFKTGLTGFWADRLSAEFAKKIPKF